MRLRELKMRLLFCLLLGTSATTLDLFTSIRHLEVADNNEKTLLHQLWTFNKQMKNKIKPLVEAYMEISVARMPELSRSEYLGHPLNAFSLIRRLVKQWPLLLALMSEVEGVDQSVELLPLETEYQNALRGIARLQEVYNIDLSEMTDQLGRNFLTAGDCLSMGQYLSGRGEYIKARIWLEQALHLITQGDTSVYRSQVLPSLYIATALSSCKDDAINELPVDLLQAILADPVAAELMFSSAELSTQLYQVLLKNCSWVNEKLHQVEQGFRMPDETSLAYNYMCSVPRPQDLIKQDTLQCYRVHHGNPRLLLAPFKVEEVYTHPPMYMFHEVISDEEIEEMKEASFKEMSDCGTVYEQRVSHSFYRVCNVGWVKDEDSPTAATISRRAGDMTSLDMVYSEQNQVAVYGLGGEFQLHQDPLLNKTLSSEDKEGNRLATLMFYMNDVPAGGRTIFPYLNIAVTPRKGSAILWFNLDHEGKMINHMWHGGCPVLEGRKWVLNKWIHEGNQGFEATCPSKHTFPHSYYINTKRNIS